MQHPHRLFPVKEHADPLLRSVTACHPAAKPDETFAVDAVLAGLA
jgi:hypothetical protein